MTPRTALSILLLGIAASVFESTTSTFLYGIPSLIRPILPCIILFVVSERPTHALLFAAAAGLVTDLLAPAPPTFAVARDVLLAVSVAFASRTVITNQSVYAAVALAIAARTLDQVWLLAARWIADRGLLGASAAATWDLAWRFALADAALVATGCVTIALVIRRFVVGRTPPHAYG